jgi:hypothetical protein
VCENQEQIASAHYKTRHAKTILDQKWQYEYGECDVTNLTCVSRREVSPVSEWYAREIDPNTGCHPARPNEMRARFVIPRVSEEHTPHALCFHHRCVLYREAASPTRLSECA